MRRTGLPAVPPMVAADAHDAVAEHPIAGTGVVFAVAGWIAPPIVTTRVPEMVVDPEFLTVSVRELTDVEPDADPPEAEAWMIWREAFDDADPARP